MAVALGAATTTLTVFGLFSGWGGMFWLDEVDLAERRWSVLGATALVSLVAGVFEASFVALVTSRWRHVAPRARRTGIVVAAVAGALWGLAGWSLVHRWLMRISPGTGEPMFGREGRVPSFMLLPLVDSLFSLLLLAALISTTVGAWSTGGRRPAKLHRPVSGTHEGLQPQRS